MNQNNAPRKKKVFVAKSFKYLLAAVSVAGTVGLWGVFSKQNVQAVNVPSTQTDLQPLPTLLALNDVQVSTTNSSSTQSDPLAALPVATQPPSKTTVSSGNTGSIQILQPAPVTQTRSSRK